MNKIVQFTEKELGHIKSKLGVHHLSVVMDHYNWFLYWKEGKHLSKAIHALTDMRVDPPK